MLPGGGVSWVRQPRLFLEHQNGSGSLGSHLHRENVKQLKKTCTWTQRWLSLVIPQYLQVGMGDEEDLGKCVQTSLVVSDSQGRGTGGATLGKCIWADAVNLPVQTLKGDEGNNRYGGSGQAGGRSIPSRSLPHRKQVSRKHSP